MQKYRQRISGPLLDRIDIRVEVPAVQYREISSNEPAEPSANIRRRVEVARTIQQKRFRGKGSGEEEGNGEWGKRRNGDGEERTGEPANRGVGEGEWGKHSFRSKCVPKCNLGNEGGNGETSGARKPAAGSPGSAGGALEGASKRGQAKRGGLWVSASGEKNESANRGAACRREEERNGEWETDAGRFLAQAAGDLRFDPVPLALSCQIPPPPFPFPQVLPDKL